MEVVNSLFEYNGFKLEDIEEMRKIIAAKRGGFQKRFVLDSVTGWLLCYVEDLLQLLEGWEKWYEMFFTVS